MLVKYLRINVLHKIYQYFYDMMCHLCPSLKIFDDIIKKFAYVVKKIGDFIEKGQEKRFKNIDLYIEI